MTSGQEKGDGHTGSDHSSYLATDRATVYIIRSRFCGFCMKNLVPRVRKRGLPPMIRSVSLVFSLISQRCIGRSVQCWERLGALETATTWMLHPLRKGLDFV